MAKASPASHASHASIDLAVFDLDGTLADTIADIAAATNRVLERASLPTHPLEAFNRFVGSGVSALIERATPAGTSSDDLAAIERAFRADYVDNLVVESRLFPGIDAMLARVADAGVAVAVLSNKPHAMTTTVVTTLLPDWGERWVALYGHRDGVAKKPEPTSLLEICRAAGVDPSRAAMVGDTPIDVETGRRAGATSLAVSWGFRPADELAAAGADAVLHSADALADRILTTR